MKFFLCLLLFFSPLVFGFDSCKNFEDTDIPLYSVCRSVADYFSSEGHVTNLVQAIKLGENLDVDCKFKYPESSLEYSLCKGNQLYLDEKVRIGNFDVVKNENTLTNSIFDAFAYLSFWNDEGGYKHCPHKAIFHGEIHQRSDQRILDAFWTGAMSAGIYKAEQLKEKRTLVEVLKEKGYKYLIHGTDWPHMKSFLSKEDNCLIIDGSKAGNERPHLFFMRMFKDFPKEIYGGLAFVLPIEALEKIDSFYLSKGWSNKGGLRVGESVTSSQTIEEFVAFIDTLDPNRENEVVVHVKRKFNITPSYIIGLIGAFNREHRADPYDTNLLKGPIIDEIEKKCEGIKFIEI